MSSNTERSSGSPQAQDIYSPDAERRIFGTLLQKHSWLLARDNFAGAIAVGRWLHQFPDYLPDLEKRQVGWIIYRLEQFLSYIEQDRKRYYTPSRGFLQAIGADTLRHLGRDILRELPPPLPPQEVRKEKDSHDGASDAP